jgi:tetratricopeptide (TPR) repeat protein
MRGRIQATFRLLIIMLAAGVANADVDLADRLSALNASLAVADGEPAAAALLLSRAELHRLERNWDAALADLESASQIDSNVEGLALRRGLALSGSGRHHESIVAFENHLSNYPEDAFAWVHLGRSFARLELHAEAAAAFNNAIERSTRPGPGLILERADAIQAQGRSHWLEALHSIEVGTSMIGRATALELRALELETMLGRFEEAIRRVSYLNDRAHSKAPWLLRKAEVLLAANRKEDAQETLEQARFHALSVPPSRRHTAANEMLLASIDDLLATSRK